MTVGGYQVSSLLDPQPRPISKRGWVYLGLGVIGLLIAVLAVSAPYRSEGASVVTGGAPTGPDVGITANISPLSVDAQLDVITTRFSFSSLDPDLVDQNSYRLIKDVRISVITWDGAQEFTYLRGSLLGGASVDVALDGWNIANYPFDEYNTELWISAVVLKPGPGGEASVAKDLMVRSAASGRVSGWNTTVVLPTEVNANQQVFVQVSREFSTKLFALSILALIVILAAMVLWIALLVATNRRPMDAVLLTWATGVLFAMPILRNALPNAPPIGVAIDIYVFFWALLGALVAAVLLAVLWARHRKAIINANN